MVAQVMITFHDKREDVDRNVGDVFELTEERYAEIMSVNPHFIRVLEGTKIEKKTSKRSKKEDA
jgi:hypothetical protein